MKFDCYRRAGLKRILRLEQVSKEEALAFLCTEKAGFVVDDNYIEYNKEELENAESIESTTTTGYHNFFADGGEVSEDSDRELFGIDTDNSESSTECDN